MTKIRDIANLMATWAPPATAMSYDNVGLQIGDASTSVKKVLVAFEITQQVIQEAKDLGVQLIVTHHPLIFKPMKSLTAGAGPSGMALSIAQAGLALYTAHTNLDATRGGVSFGLADKLGLEDVDFLDPMKGTLSKLTTFVPKDHFESVRQALANAGAGQIGNYDNCSFATEGTGYFQPSKDANPFIGSAGGGLEKVNEIKIEVICERWNLNRIVSALKASHPYETVAYDTFDLTQTNDDFGMGAIGTLPEPESIQTFLKRVAGRLETSTLRYAGGDDQMIQRVAVCGGAGSSLINKAKRAKADAYITGDITYHLYFDVHDKNGIPDMALIDAGHYETEFMTEKLICDKLEAHFPEIDVIKTKIHTNPVRSFTFSQDLS